MSVNPASLSLGDFMVLGGREILCETEGAAACLDPNCQAGNNFPQIGI